MGGMGMLVLTCCLPAAAQAQPPTVLPLPPTGPVSVLEQTAAAVRAPTADERYALVRDLLARGETAAAEAALDRWSGEEDRPLRFGLLRATLYDQRGEPELAQRELDRLAPPEKGDDGLWQTAGLYRQVLRGRLSGQPVGVERNPWDVVFETGGGYVAGGIDPIQGDKVGPWDVAALEELLRLRPTAGNLWALLGLFYAAGDRLEVAEQAMRRAQSLQYTPLALLERHAAVERELAARRLAADQALAAATTPEAATPAEPPAPPAALTRTRVWIVLAFGAALVLTLVGLQVRQWLRRAAS